MEKWVSPILEERTYEHGTGHRSKNSSHFSKTLRTHQRKFPTGGGVFCTRLITYNTTRSFEYKNPLFIIKIYGIESEIKLLNEFSSELKIDTIKCITYGVETSFNFVSNFLISLLTQLICIFKLSISISLLHFKPSCVPPASEKIYSCMHYLKTNFKNCFSK